MKCFLVSAAAAFFSLLVCPASLAATSWGMDLSDLWWNPGESGWGVQIAHQGDTLFVTLYVYGPDARARWYVASGMQSQGAAGKYSFSGDLHETSGPCFSGSFDPAGINVRKVGVATFTAHGAANAVLTYGVDGVVVTKSIQRNTFRRNSVAGYYSGWLQYEMAPPCGSGVINVVAEDYEISHSGESVSILRRGRPPYGNPVGLTTCTISGTYSQSGRMGAISGTQSCEFGPESTFQATEIESGNVGMLLVYTARYANGCTEVGRIGAVKFGRPETTGP